MKENRIIAFLSVLLVAVLALLFYRLQSHNFLPSSQPDSTLAVPRVQQLRLGVNIPPGTALHAAAERFAQRVSEGSRQSIRVSVYPNQQLGNDSQMLEMARRGELDLVLIPTAKFSTDLPEMQVFDLPFFFPSRQLLYQALDGQLGTTLLERLDGIGLKGLAFWENGFKQLTANRPLLVPTDFKGLKMRVMNSPILQDQFESLGATTIPIDFHATRKALADGVVDGQENPLVAIVSMKFHEVQSHMTISNHAYLGYVFAMSKNSFDRLSSKDQHLIVTTAQALTAWERDETKRYEEQFMDTARQAGMTIDTLSPAELKTFQQVLDYLPRKFEQTIGADIISQAQEVIVQYLASQTQAPEILIGLDADLSAQSARVGLAFKQGIQLAIHTINQQGGLLGRPLRLMARDHQGVPERGRANIRFFAEQPNLVAIVGGKDSTVVLEELDLIHQYQVPYLIPWAAASELTENGQQPNFVFRVSLNDRLVVPFLTETAVQRGHPIAIVFENNAWGRQNNMRIQAYLSQLGQQPAGSWRFPPGEKNFQDTITHIVSTQAKSVLLIASPKSSLSFIKALSSAVPHMPILSHWGLIGDAMTAEEINLLADKKVVFPQTVLLYPPDTDRVQRLLSEYRSYFQTDSHELIRFGAGFVHAYDLIHLLAQAIVAGNSLDRQVIRAALEQLHAYEGIVKTYHQPFTAERHDALGLDEYRLAQFLKTGHIVLVDRVDP
ncbi:MAG: DctP family TRAP transporter solute-binding subunit [Magnetococcales bacterium]|nr:DctP family TRAP transporter solute-binding subunit [Magnetococcales bacterium]